MLTDAMLKVSDVTMLIRVNLAKYKDDDDDELTA